MSLFMSLSEKPYASFKGSLWNHPLVHVKHLQCSRSQESSSSVLHLDRSHLWKPCRQRQVVSDSSASESSYVKGQRLVSNFQGKDTYLAKRRRHAESTSTKRSKIKSIHVADVEIPLREKPVMVDNVTMHNARVGCLNQTRVNKG